MISIVGGLTAVLACAVCIALGPARADATRASAQSRSHRVFVMGIDGMDPSLLKELMARGDMPNFSRLAQSGDFRPLRTANPPQSPVAWSNVISGADSTLVAAPLDAAAADSPFGDSEHALKNCATTKTASAGHRPWFRMRSPPGAAFTRLSKLCGPSASGSRRAHGQ